MTTQTTLTLNGSPIFMVGIGDTVECFSSRKTAIVVAIHGDADDRKVAQVVNVETGATMMPFVDECRVSRKFVSYGGPVRDVISDDTAARLRAYAEAR